MPARYLTRVALAACTALIGTGALAEQPTSTPTKTTPTTGAPTTTTPTSDGVIVTGKSATDTVKAGKITDPKHPDFVKCRSEPVLNSRAARTRVCRTNREWTAAAREGNRRTEELLNSGRPTQPTP